MHHKLRCVSHCKYGKLFLLRKPFRFFVFASQTLQVFRLALRKKAQYVVVVTTRGTLSQVRTPDPVHPRRCARILVVVAVKTSSQYLHLTLVLSPRVLGSSCWTMWACSGPFSLTMAAVKFLILILRSSTMLLHRDIWNLEAGNFKLDQTRTKHWHARRQATVQT